MRSQQRANDTREIVIHGRAVSRGVAHGRLVCIYGSNRQFYHSAINRADLAAERTRLNNAVDFAKSQLAKIERSTAEQLKSASGIVEAQILMLDDEELQTRFDEHIASKLVNAEWAVKAVTDELAARYRSLPDDNISERFMDIEDIGERILAALSGASLNGGIRGEEILAAEELRPSTLAELAGNPPRAIVTERGGWTSHTFILARELNLPAVTGVRDLLRRVRSGQEVIVDGNRGVLLLEPSTESIDQSFRAAPMESDLAKPARAESRLVVKTLDQREITLCANLDVPAVYRTAKKFGARGIGLYRSEFLFNQFNGFPTEDEQFAAYSELCEFAGDDGANVRLFDLGLNQIFGQTHSREKNPALGLRAIRLGLSFEQHLRTQLRALLRASKCGKIRILVPMVSGLFEIREVKRLVDEESASLSYGETAMTMPALGAMIEVPSTVLMIEELVEETDFIALGTNDLVQYLLAVDRDNEIVADWFSTLHPAVIRAIAKVADAAARGGKPLIACGEMAASPYYVPLLIGLGINRLSMNFNAIPRLREIIAKINFSDAAELANSLLNCRTTRECEAVLDRRISEDWSEILAPLER
ncbi:MAG: phosphoenolpyruvate--protein phosphotransferase [Acidobacteria bacterium]|nr:phosphoenolpyruvate--protein phosphotransferase [Acidobacteriota bacterium]